MFSVLEEDGDGNLGRFTRSEGDEPAVVEKAGVVVLKGQGS